jgi:hypothetical protein
MLLYRRAVLLPVLCLFAACAGKDAAAPIIQQPQPTRTTTGVVYVRSDAVAYGTDATSPPMVSGAQLQFADATGVSGSGGAFSLSTPFIPASDYIPITAAASGYQAAQMPYLLYKPTQPVQIGLYPEAAVTPRPGFIKAFELFDSGGGLAQFYQAGRLTTVMDLVRTPQYGANLVKTVEAFSLRRFNIATNTVVMGGDPWGNYTRAMYLDLVGKAKARGLQFMLSLEITAWPGNNPTPLAAGDAADFAMRFQIPATNAAFWDAFFAAWSPLIIERATIARDAGVEYLALGQNLNYLTRLETARWQKLISAIRATGYTGKIVYFGTMKGDVGLGQNEWDAIPAATRALFDVIGIRWQAVVAKTSTSDVLAEEQPRSRMRADVTRILATMTGYGAPIMILMTTPSVHGAPIRSEFIEPCLDAACASVAPLRTLDFQQQADAYQAVAEAINAMPTGNGRVMGLITTQYWYFEDFTSAGRNAYDKSSSIRGKPAEAVLKWWFQRW